MKKDMSRRLRIRSVSFLTSLIIVLAIWGGVNFAKVNKYERNLNAAQQRALSNLSTYMDSISSNLQKGIYANTSPMLANIASQVWLESTAAKNALAELPAQHQELVNTYKFLSQVGDYTMSLNEKVSKGQKITSKETESLFSMMDVASKLSEQVSYLLAEELAGNLNYSIKQSAAETKEIGKKTEDVKIQFNGVLADSEEQLADFPTLLYDGPFADNVMKKEPEMTKGKDAISIDKARQVAAEYLNVDIKTLSQGEQESGNLPCYVFNGPEFTIAITKHGGFMCYFLGWAYAGESVKKPSEAVDIAIDFLKKHGIENMTESYFTTTDGICTVNLAYVQNGVICYPDLVKVSVALDTGDVVSVDARGYIMNHKTHEIIDSPKYSVTDAQKFLSEYLTIKNISKTVIPTDSGGEKFAYEYYCVGKNKQELLVYIDPETGFEENILILLYSDNGVLTK
ncbi:MAG TPA: PepSY1/2 domain-containing protein [Oscillospiraceae bacterium]|nr:PepSY1/2 domain-containing protein [Oscillospiraceae bacterium]